LKIKYLKAANENYAVFSLNKNPCHLDQNGEIFIRIITITNTIKTSRQAQGNKLLYCLRAWASLPALPVSGRPALYNKFPNQNLFAIIKA